MPKRKPHKKPRSSGFTMIELVMVMVLAGILAVAIIPRFANKSAFDERGFFDQSISMVRYAQKVAIAQRRNVFVNTTTNAICLTYVTDANCASTTQSEKVFALSPMPLITDQSWMYATAPAGIRFGTTTSFSFSALGKPTAGTVININSTGPMQTITVEAETGYVH
ncbi:MAG: type II secretion system protein [Pseudomonadota bacterium]